MQRNAAVDSAAVAFDCAQRIINSNESSRTVYFYGSLMALIKIARMLEKQITAIDRIC